MSNVADERATAKCGKCFDTGTVYESHGEGVDCEAPGCTAAGRPAQDSPMMRAARERVYAAIRNLNEDDCHGLAFDQVRDIVVDLWPAIAAEIERVERERDNVLTQLSVANEVIGEVRGVCKAGEAEETTLAVRRALQEAKAEAVAGTLDSLLRRK